jgi:hypothetical protein
MKTIKHTLFKLILIGGLILSADAALADGWGHHGRGHGHDRHWAPAYTYYGGPRYYGRDRGDNFSLSLNFGSPGYPSGSVTYGNVYRPAPVIVQPARPVIIEQNTYVTGGAPSLFRDRYGRCYERSYNSVGTEIRTEVPASACNF